MIISKKKLEEKVREEVERRLKEEERARYYNERIENLYRYTHEACERLSVELEKLKLRFSDEEK